MGQYAGIAGRDQLTGFHSLFDRHWTALVELHGHVGIEFDHKMESSRVWGNSFAEKGLLRNSPQTYALAYRLDLTSRRLIGCAWSCDRV